MTTILTLALAAALAVAGVIESPAFNGLDLLAVLALAAAVVKAVR